MADIEALLRQRSSQVYPTRAQLDRAARSHNFLREVLRTGNMDSRIIDSYLSGSYSRYTALRPLEDVDIIVEIDPSRWRRGTFARLFDGLPEPEAVLETFAVATRLRYQTYGSSVWKQRRSIRLVLFANYKRDRLVKLARAARVMRYELEGAAASRSARSAWARIAHRLRARLDQL